MWKNISFTLSSIPSLQKSTVMLGIVCVHVGERCSLENHWPIEKPLFCSPCQCWFCNKYYRMFFVHQQVLHFKYIYIVVSFWDQNEDHKFGDIQMVLCIKCNFEHTISLFLVKMVVVLHHSGNCAACSSMGHLMLMTAHAARHLPNITFARINLLHNTLPWHLTFHTLPTIIVHPHFR